MNKKSLIVAIGLILSAEANFAGGLGPVPSVNPHPWYSGVDAIYGILNNHDINYDPVRNYYAWGLHAEVGYFFDDNNNDVNFNYLGLFNDHNSTLELAIQERLNVANLELGHEFNIGKWMFRPFGGVEYVNIDRSFTEFDTFPGFNHNLRENAAGPRFGVNGRYALSPNLAIHYGAALGTLYNVWSQKIGSEVFSRLRGVAWTSEANLGLSYQINQYTVRAGYKIYSFNQNGQEGGGRHLINGFNFGLSGPYLGLHLTF